MSLAECCRLLRGVPLSSFILAALLALAAPAQASDGARAVEGEILVKLRSTAALGPLLAKYGLTVLDSFGHRPIYRLKVAEKSRVDDTIAALALEVDVLIAEANVLQRSPEARKNVVWAIGKPEDYAAQWAPTALRLPEAQRLALGTGVRVAVLDTGIDLHHPALAGRLLPGFDFVDYDNDPSEAGGEGDVGYGHGTHVAGLVALIAPNARIMPLRVLDADGEGNAWVLAEALLHAVDPDGDPTTDDGAHVINLSFGTASRTRIFDAAAQLATCTMPATPDPVGDLSDPGYDDDEARCSRFRGVVIVAAAGNDGSDSVREYPAAESAHGLIAVGASSSNGRLASFSNFGSWVRIAAPGDKVTSSVPGGGYGTWSGTSMSAPLVAGAAALLRGYAPRLKADDVVKRLTSRTAALCGTNLRQLDIAAALLDRSPPTVNCR